MRRLLCKIKAKQFRITSYNVCYTKLLRIAQLKGRGLIVTAPGNTVDFVSRFFAPQAGIDEDPVTGSTHTSLTPLWSKKLNKEKLTAKQLSKRVGDLICEYQGQRCSIRITSYNVCYTKLLRKTLPVKYHLF